jgi:uncharacterized RDD family membrane protein YckC
MNKLIFRRLAAFVLDYLIIAAYALLVFGLMRILGLADLNLTPISRQLLGLIALTLPVFLYFYLMEKSGSRATLGKKAMGISICSISENIEPKILLRNILKFLPWEIAHAGVHWVVYYSYSENDVPLWVWLLLIIPQIIMITYLLSIILSRGETSLYDRMANTKLKLSLPGTRPITAGN